MKVFALTSNLQQIMADDGKYIHRKGDEKYFRKGIMREGETTDDFEEVDERPAYTKGQYEAKVAEMVREGYTASEEFALQRKAINAICSPAVTDADSTAMAEYEAYNAYVEQCKQRAKDPELYRQIYL